MRGTPCHSWESLPEGSFFTSCKIFASKAVALDTAPNRKSGGQLVKARLLVRKGATVPVREPYPMLWWRCGSGAVPTFIVHGGVPLGHSLLCIWDRKFPHQSTTFFCTGGSVCCLRFPLGLWKCCCIALSVKKSWILSEMTYWVTNKAEFYTRHQVIVKCLTAFVVRNPCSK